MYALLLGSALTPHIDRWTEPRPPRWSTSAMTQRPPPEIRHDFGAARPGRAGHHRADRGPGDRLGARVDPADGAGAARRLARRRRARSAARCSELPDLCAGCRGPRRAASRRRRRRALHRPGSRTASRSARPSSPAAWATRTPSSWSTGSIRSRRSFAGMRVVASRETPGLGSLIVDDAEVRGGLRRGRAALRCAGRIAVAAGARGAKLRAGRGRHDDGRDRVGARGGAHHQPKPGGMAADSAREYEELAGDRRG
jgi:hypothetical protein